MWLTPATNKVTPTVSVGTLFGVAVAPDGTKIYVTQLLPVSGGNVVEINTTYGTIANTIPLENGPFGVAISPDGTKIYVTSANSTTSSGAVYVIDTVKNAVTATVFVGNDPEGVALTPDGAKVYVANSNDNTVSVIDTATNKVTATVNVGNYPISIGQFIGKTAPTIIWSNPTDIVYGTALSSKQLNAIASVPGKFVYTPPSGTVLNAGQQQILNTTFTPTDNINYTQAKVTVSITVTKATPTITWKNPAYIVYGTVLSSAQLDATASVPGTFVYTPPLGTAFSTGTHTLTTCFKPTDTVDYTTASATASINVLTPVQAIDQIIASIQKLVTSGTLSSGISRPLISQLNAAKSNLNSGQTNKAINQLNIFITEVDIYINSGILSQTNGQLLIDAANAIIQA
jgi:YVTN family beta-propeller protein